MPSTKHMLSLFVCLLLNDTSALFRLLVPRIVEINLARYVKNDLRPTSNFMTNQYKKLPVTMKLLVRTNYTRQSAIQNIDEQRKPITVLSTSRESSERGTNTTSKYLLTKLNGTKTSPLPSSWRQAIELSSLIRHSMSR